MMTSSNPHCPTGPHRARAVPRGQSPHGSGCGCDALGCVACVVGR